MSKSRQRPKIESGSNLSGGLSNLISGGKQEEVKEKEEKDTLVKTFMISQEDMDFINRYVLYKGYKTGEKYTQKQAIHDGLALLRKAHPEVD